MEPIGENTVYQGIDVDLVFNHQQPMFGDLFLVCGYSHPDFPPSGDFKFDKLSELNFSQADDYFGIENAEGNVIVWLYPLIGQEVAYHHPGPFTGLRLGYNVLRNPVQNKSIFLNAIRLFSQYHDVEVLYKLRNMNLGYPLNLSMIEKDIDQIISYWKDKNVETGSESALRIVY